MHLFYTYSTFFFIFFLEFRSCTLHSFDDDNDINDFGGGNSGSTIGQKRRKLSNKPSQTFAHVNTILPSQKRKTIWQKGNIITYLVVLFERVVLDVGALSLNLLSRTNEYRAKKSWLLWSRFVVNIHTSNETRKNASLSMYVYLFKFWLLSACFCFLSTASRQAQSTVTLNDK